MRGFLLDADGFHTIDFPGTQFTIATGLNPQAGACEDGRSGKGDDL